MFTLNISHCIELNMFFIEWTLSTIHPFSIACKHSIIQDDKKILNVHLAIFFIKFIVHLVNKFDHVVQSLVPFIVVYIKLRQVSQALSIVHLSDCSHVCLYISGKHQRISWLIPWLAKQIYL